MPSNYVPPLNNQTRSQGPVLGAQLLPSPLLALQVPPSTPMPTGSTTGTNPVLPPQDILSQLGNFPEQVYDMGPNSHLFRLMSVLLGDAGVGQLRKNLLLSRLEGVLGGSHFYDLDGFYGALFGVTREVTDDLAFDPYAVGATSKQWMDAAAIDAAYKARILAFGRAIGFGATAIGMKLIAEAILNVECDVYEQYHQADRTEFTYNTLKLLTYDKMKNYTYDELMGYGTINSSSAVGRNVFLIRPKRPITLDESYDVTRVIDRLRPYNTVCIIDTQGMDLYSPVPIQGIYSDSTYWEITKRVASVPVNGKQIYPVQSSTPVEQPRPAFTGAQGGEWSYNRSIMSVNSYSRSANGGQVSPLLDKIIFSDGTVYFYQPTFGYLLPRLAWASSAIRDGHLVSGTYDKRTDPSAPASLYINSIPIENLLPVINDPSVVSGLNQAYNTERFWATPISADVYETDYLELNFASSVLVNTIELQISHYPHVMTIQFLNVTTDTWVSVYTTTVYNSIPSQFLNLVPGQARVHPQHPNSNWVDVNIKLDPVQATKWRIALQRTDPETAWPMDAVGNPVPYSLAVRNLNFKYVVTSLNDIPNQALQTPIASSLDIFGNPEEHYFTTYPASGILNAQPWRSEPQPSPDAVVNLYLDTRDAHGNAAVVDRFYIDPVDTGPRINLYWSNSNPTGSFTASNTPLDQEVVSMIGPVLDTSSGIQFPLTDAAYIDIAMRAIQFDATGNWWIGMQIVPNFPETDPYHPIIDIGIGAVELGVKSLLFRLYDNQEVNVPLQWTPGDVLTIIVFQETQPNPDFPIGIGVQVITSAGQSGYGFTYDNVTQAPDQSEIRLGGFLPQYVGPLLRQRGLMEPVFNSLMPTQGDVYPSFAQMVVPGQTLTDNTTGATSVFTVATAPVGATQAFLTHNVLDVAGPGLQSSMLGTTQLGSASVSTIGETHYVDEVGLFPGTTLSYQPALNIVPAADASFEGTLGTAVAGVNTIIVDTNTWAATGSYSMALESTSSGTISATEGPYPVTAGQSYVFTAAYHASSTPRSCRTDIVWDVLSTSKTPSNPGIAGYTLDTMVVKDEALSVANAAGFLADPQSYILTPVSPIDQTASTDNAILRYSPAFLSSTNLTGFVGGPPNQYSSLSWTPVIGNYVSERGYLVVPPNRAKYWKFEFTSLAPEPFEILTPVTATVQTFPGTVPSPGMNGVNVARPGTTTNAKYATAESFLDAPIYRSTDPPPVDRNYKVTEGLYPTDTGRQITQKNGLNLLPWQASSVVAKFPTTGIHAYQTDEYIRSSKIGFFAGMKQLVAQRVNYYIDEDTVTYVDFFWDQQNIATFGEWIIDPNDVHTIGTTAAIATSIVFESNQDVAAVQFATQQSDAVEIVGDDDFTDPALAANKWDGTYGWSSQGDATLTWSAPSTVMLSRTNTIPTSSGGIQSKTYPASPKGRLYAAVRFTAQTNLTSPVHLQLIGSDGTAILADLPITARAGQTVEQYIGYTIGQTPAPIYSSPTLIQRGLIEPVFNDMAPDEPALISQSALVEVFDDSQVAVRLVQYGVSDDVIAIDTLSVFDQSIVWEFTTDGTNWYQALDARNNPNGQVSFPQPGKVLQWRVSAYRDNLHVHALEIRPWYQTKFGSRSNADLQRGPNLSHYDSTPPIQEDPLFLGWSKPVPLSWFLISRSLPVLPIDDLLPAGTPEGIVRFGTETIPTLTDTETNFVHSYGYGFEGTAPNAAVYQAITRGLVKTMLQPVFDLDQNVYSNFNFHDSGSAPGFSATGQEGGQAYWPKIVQGLDQPLGYPIFAIDPAPINAFHFQDSGVGTG